MGSTTRGSTLYPIRIPYIFAAAQVVAFQATMELMAKEFPGAFSGYNMQVGTSLATSVTSEPSLPERCL